MNETFFGEKYVVFNCFDRLSMKYHFIVSYIDIEEKKINFFLELK